MAILSGIWPNVVDFTMIAHYFFSNHVIAVANFENFFISPGFRKSTQKISKS